MISSVILKHVNISEKNNLIYKN